MVNNSTLCETCWGLVALSTGCVVKDYCICEHPDIVKEYINMQVMLQFVHWEEIVCKESLNSDGQQFHQYQQNKQ
jgi:hypothetical protein